MYTEEFKDFVNKSTEQGEYIGLGNPNSQILFIGKEPSISKKEHLEYYNKNAVEWQNHILNNTKQIQNYIVDENHIFRTNNQWGKNTWSKYQTLKNYIFEEEPKEYHIDFLEKVFTTEINNSPSKNTSTADKRGLNKRKLFFKDSLFIKQFPVVVLACSDYIKNNDEIREIDDIFNVKYVESKIYNIRTMNSFYIHYNENRTRLVIHTRQLSQNVQTELLKDLGLVIRSHLEKINEL